LLSMSFGALLKHTFLLGKYYWTVCFYDLLYCAVQTIDVGLQFKRYLFGF
jgi:hypothetical protein